MEELLHTILTANPSSLAMLSVFVLCLGLAAPRIWRFVERLRGERREAGTDGASIYRYVDRRTREAVEPVSIRVSTLERVSERREALIEKFGEINARVDHLTGELVHIREQQLPAIAESQSETNEKLAHVIGYLEAGKRDNP